MYAQSKNVIQSATCLLLVFASCFGVCGCLGTKHADGWTSRPVIITVTDADTTQPVSGAMVKLKAPDDMQKFLANKEKYEKVTDVNGKAELIVWFGFGSSQTLWFKKGSFSLSGAGTLEADAEGYKHFEREFVLLTGEYSRSVNDKSPVKVNVKLSK